MVVCRPPLSCRSHTRKRCIKALFCCRLVSEHLLVKISRSRSLASSWRTSRLEEPRQHRRRHLAQDQLRLRRQDRHQDRQEPDRQDHRDHQARQAVDSPARQAHQDRQELDSQDLLGCRACQDHQDLRVCPLLLGRRELQECQGSTAPPVRQDRQEHRALRLSAHQVSRDQPARRVTMGLVAETVAMVWLDPLGRQARQGARPAHRASELRAIG